MASNKLRLPTDEELAVPEDCQLSFPYLRAGAFHLGKYCEVINNEFMLCKSETRDPRKCLNEGKMVTACSMDFFRKIKKNCADEFFDYARCLDITSPSCRFEKCRKTQAIFDTCVLEKLNVERPPYGYFTEIQIHDSVRPRPTPEPPIKIEYPLQELPKKELLDNAPPSNYGARIHGTY